MKPVTVTASIAAVPDRVYETIVDVELLPKTSPDTVSVEFLGEQRTGAGTRFLETRRMGKQSEQFELELTECDPSARTARFVCDHGGVVWDTTMEVAPDGDGSRVQFTMSALTDSTMKRLIFTLMRGVFRKAMNRQVDALRDYCETPDRS